MYDKSELFRKRVIEGIIRGIKRSPETMEFLSAEIKEIFLEEKSKWISQLSEEESKFIYHPDYHGEYYGGVDKKSEKYLQKWFTDLMSRGYFKIESCPNSIMDSINYFTEDLIDHLSEDLFYELSMVFTNKIYDEEDAIYESHRIPGERVSHP